MPPPEARDEAPGVARLLARLLADPGYRAEFRRDPAGAARAAGLPALARSLGGGGLGPETLEVRESRSVLAGVAAAAIVEGVGDAVSVGGASGAGAGGDETLAAEAREAAGGPAAWNADLYRRGTFPAVRPDQVVGDPERLATKGPDPLPAYPAGGGTPAAAAGVSQSTLGGLSAAPVPPASGSTLGGIPAVPGAEGIYAVAEAMASPPPGASGLGAAAALEAHRFLGTPYVWGGESPGGFDCSGLVRHVYARLGVAVPRVAADQAMAGLPVSHPALLQPGDLVYFDEGGGYIEHIGMYVGDGRFLHASSGGDVVKISSLEEPYYASHYAGARRILAAADAVAGAAPPGGTLGSAAAAGPGPSRGTLGGVPAVPPSALGPSPSASTMGGLDAVPEPADAAALQAALAGALPVDPALFPYPGDGAPPEAIARWMAAAAAARGLPPELPVMASLVESGLRNLPHGDRDSLGLFQQRPSQGWGGPAEVLDPYHALGRFLHKAALADADGRYSVAGPDALGAWCQAVQRSAFPERYQPRLAEARALLGA